VRDDELALAIRKAQGATSRQVYTRLERVEIFGLEPRDQVSIRVMDFASEDIKAISSSVCSFMLL